MMSESTQPGYAIFVRIFRAGEYYLLSGGNMSYPPMYLEDKLKIILKAYKKSGQTDGVNRFLRNNGYLFGGLFKVIWDILKCSLVLNNLNLK